MPFFDYDLLHKLITPGEEKKIQVFMNYLMFDVFSDKISYPTFKERMDILNQQKNFDLFKVFKEICGKDRKYITYPRFVEAFMGYQQNSTNYSLDLKNFMAFVNNELVFDYNDKYLGNTNVPNIKEFSTKNMQNRKALTNVQVYSNSLGEIVGLQFTYDEKYKNLFIAPEAKDSFYEMKINCNLKVNEDFIDEQDRNNPDVDKEYARDYITHIYGTHSYIIESLGFKTAFGKHYFTGKPLKGKQFLLGTTKKRFHYMKFGMKSHFNYATFKFLPALGNPNLTVKVSSFTDEDYDKVFEDEVILTTLKDGFMKDNMIRTPLLNEKAMLSEDFLEGDCKGDEIEDIAIDSDNDEEDEDKKVYKIIDKLAEEDYKVVLRENYEIMKEKKIQEKAKIKVQKKLEKERQKKFKQEEDDFVTNVNYIDIIDSTDDLKNAVEVVEDIRSMPASEILLSEVIADSSKLENFITRYAKSIKEELDEQVIIQEKINAMKNDFYIRYLNRNKKPKDWELIELKTKNDPLGLQQEYFNIMKMAGKFILPNETIPEKAYERESIPMEKIVENWQKFKAFLNRKKKTIYIREIALTVAKGVLVHKEMGDENYRNYDLKEKISVLKLIHRLQFDKALIRNLIAQGIAMILDKKKKKKKDINAMSKKQTKVNIVSKSKSKITIGEGVMNQFAKLDADLEKALEKEKEKQKKKPKTEKEVVEFVKKHLKIEKQYLFEHLIEVARIINLDVKEYNKLIRMNICGDKLEEIEDYISELKLVKKFIIQKLQEEGKSAILSNSGINHDDYLKKEIEKRKKILDLNKEEKVKEMKQDEEKSNAKILEPIKAGNIISSDKSVKIYRGQKVPEQGLFVDPLFTPEISSLCPIDQSNQFELPEGCEPQDIEGFEDYEWTNFEKIFKGKNYQVFMDKIEENDIIQGGLGDCYFLSAIAALTKFPDLIKGLFPFQERSEEGCYGVRYRINGNWKTVLVDESIPGDGGARPNFAFSAANGKELWVVLLEKAWAKLCGCFAKACAGLPSEVFDCISNSVTENIDINHKAKDLIWEKLSEGKKNNFIMTAGTGGDPDIDYDSVNLVVGHAYTVLDSYEVSRAGMKVKLVKLRNPWGNSEYSGDWCDSSSLWTDKLRKEVGQVESDDGVFFMSLDDFLTYFVIFSLCHIYPDFNTNAIKVPKEKTLVPAVNLLDIKVDDKYIFQIHQKNPRFKLKDGNYVKNSFCFIMVMDDKFNLLKAITSDYHTEGFEILLKKGKYYVVSDVSYRYVDSKNLHSYYVSSIGKTPGDFYDCQISYSEVIEKGITNYALKNLTPSIHPGTEKIGGVEIYSLRKYGTEFPYVFYVFKNNTKSSVEAVFKIRYPNKRDIEFLDDPKNNEKKDTILPGGTKAFIVRVYGMMVAVEHSYSLEVLGK